MLTTYEAVLRGNHIEWAREVPEYVKANLPINVHVTFLDVVPRDTVTSPGRRMADILEKLAALPVRTEIDDPMAWQREVRKDRVLPGRD